MRINDNELRRLNIKPNSVVFYIVVASSAFVVLAKSG
jgi:hypothetical protein